MASPASEISHSTVGVALKQARRRLNLYDTATIDAEILLGHVLGTTRSYLHTWPERKLDTVQLAQFNALIERRLCGEPVAYITGRREFWSLELNVTRDTLIPRPETELLVELALQHIPAHAAWNIADLGTGSGAIALALARERPHCKIVATDISPAALEIARANAARLNIRNVEFRLGSSDWFASLQNESFDMIVSNPPYIRSNDACLQDLRFEPEIALVAGADGLQHLRVIVERSREYLTPSLTLPRQGGGDIQVLPRQAGGDAHRGPYLTSTPSLTFCATHPAPLKSPGHTSCTPVRPHHGLTLHQGGGDIDHAPYINSIPSLALPRQGGGDNLPSSSGEYGDAGGWLLLEHGYDQGPDMLHMLTQLGYVNVQDYADLAALPRIVAAQWVSPHG